MADLAAGDASALEASLGMAAPSLSVTDELYDVSSYSVSTLFENAQVMSSSSTRDGTADSILGLARLAEVRDGVTSSLIPDGRGSIVQETLSGEVSAWHGYSAFGEVRSGTDMAERSFFGYNGEETSSLTGLIYLRARHYDPTTARFGVADTYLGSTFEPLSLNRYLYCQSDPVNNVDPSGHWIARMNSPLNPAKLNKAALAAAHPKWYGKTGGTKINGNSFANLPGQISILTELLSPFASFAEVQAQGRRNTARWRAQQALNSGNASLAAYNAYMANYYKQQMRAFYCGDGAGRIKDYSALHGVLDVTSMFIMFPVISSVPDAINGWIYTEEGDDASAQLSFALAGIGFIAGSAGKIGKGAGLVTKASKVAGKTESTAKSGFEVYQELVKSGKVSSINQMNDQILKGSAPKSIVRVEAAKQANGIADKPHVHFSDGTSLNYDGTIHDSLNGVHSLTNKERKWLEENGWFLEGVK